MQVPRPDLEAVRRDSTARAVVGRWRALSGGRGVRDPDRRTLVACSGGADSTALALALAAGGGGVTVGHVVHDLREPGETQAERDRVHLLAAGLGLPFVEAGVAVRARPGNAEANARRARYGELERMAWEAGCPFVAPGHHPGAQHETMLMGMLRGAGVGGLAGMPGRRGLGRRGVVLVRPMLGVGRAEAERVCGLAGVKWATDPTNADISRFRAALRHGVVRDLEALRPGGMQRAAELAEHLREVRDLLDTLAAGVLAQGVVEGDTLRWERGPLASAHPAVLAAALRAAYARQQGGRFGDRLASRSVRRVVEAIGDGNRSERRFVWKAAEVVVGAGGVSMRKTESEG